MRLQSVRSRCLAPCGATWGLCLRVTRVRSGVGAGGKQNSSRKETKKKRAFDGAGGAEEMQVAYTTHARLPPETCMVVPQADDGSNGIIMAAMQLKTMAPGCCLCRHIRDAPAGQGGDQAAVGQAGGHSEDVCGAADRPGHDPAHAVRCRSGRMREKQKEEIKMCALGNGHTEWRCSCNNGIHVAVKRKETCLAVFRQLFYEGEP